MAYCRAHGLGEHGWQPIVKRHPAEQALTLANKLESGLRPADGSALGRLGFADLNKMVAAAVPLGLISNDSVILLSERTVPHPRTRQTTTIQQGHTVSSKARFVERLERNNDINTGVSTLR